MKRFLLYICISTLLTACNFSDIIEQDAPHPPKITLDSPTGIYTVKVGRELTIAPTVENGDGASFEWRSDSEILGTGPTLTCRWEEIGTYFITLTVRNDDGSDEEELRADVVGLMPPAVSLGVPSLLRVARDAEYPFAPEILNADVDGFACEWFVDGTKAADGTAYTFRQPQTGTYSVVCRASNIDGSTEAETTVEVVDKLPCEIYFPILSHEYSANERYIFIGTPAVLSLATVNMTDPRVVWSVDGEVVERNGGTTFRYTPATAGRHTVYAAASERGESEAASATASIDIVCVDLAPAGRFRAATASSSAEWSRVFEYTPAPGQFIGDMQTGGFDGSESTAGDACAYAERRLGAGQFVSLGSWGGYIIVGFDHSVPRRASGWDFAIGGNAFISNGGSSNEPGIVWVMQDVNGNGQPDDEWFELRGSETGKPSTLQNYSVTYFRPAAAGMAVQWSSISDGSGTVDYLKAFHHQDSYYPGWIAGESITFWGTRLEARNEQQSTGNWSNPPYDYGYADNVGSDIIAEGGAGGEGQTTGFRIANAMYADSTPADLEYIDFIKVQSGVLAKSGHLGENSTEVLSFRDLSAE